MVNCITLNSPATMDTTYNKWFKKLSKKYGEDIVQDAYIIHNRKYGPIVKDYALLNKIAYYEFIYKRKLEKTKGIQSLDYVVTEEGESISLPLLRYESLTENQIHLEEDSAEDVYQKDMVRLYQILNFLNSEAKAASMFLLYSLSNLNMFDIAKLFDTNRQVVLRSIHQISKDINKHFISNHFKDILSNLRHKTKLPEVKNLLQKLILNNDKASYLLLLNIFRPFVVLKYRDGKWCSELSEGVYIADSGQLFINSAFLSPVLINFSLEDFTYGIFTDIIDSLITSKLSSSGGE